MAPLIEDIRDKIIIAKDTAIDELSVEKDTLLFNDWKDTYLNNLEKEYCQISESLFGEDKQDGYYENLLVIEQLLKYGTFPDTPQEPYLKYIERVRADKKERYYDGSYKIDEFYLGVAWDFDALRLQFPVFHSYQSGHNGIRRMPTSFLSGGKKKESWDPKKGYLQVSYKELSDLAEIIVTLKVPQKSHIYKALKTVNDATGMFD